MSGAAVDIDHLRGWIGRERTMRDIVTPRLAASLAAVLDDAGDHAAGEKAPPGIHWCLCPDIVPTAGLGEDGHPLRGGFLPPVPLPRRMWAAGSLRFHAPLHVGDVVDRTSCIVDVALKQGRSGPLCFLMLSHRYAVGEVTVIEERQDIVYREAGAPAAAPPRRPAPAAPGTFLPTPVLLQRYSALTFNAHRIHYDQDYCREVEGYADLVVHGPLQATLLLRLAIEAQPRHDLHAFSFRSLSPAFAGASLTLERSGSEPMTLRTIDADGRVAMEAIATWTAGPSDHPAA
jgi:3-methylfumaryl-CoA hydratase